MNQKDNIQEITLLDLFSAIAKKWKMLLCITLAALIVGGAVGAVSAVLSNQSYGARAEFYVYSDKANKYILSLVKSDSFAETVLMDENGLPEEYKDTAEYKTALEANKVVAALEEEIKEKEKELTKFDGEISKKNRIYTDKKAAFDEVNKYIEMMFSSQIVDYTEEIEKYLNEILPPIKEERDNAKKAYNDELDKKQDAEKEITDLKDELEEAEKLKDKTYGVVMAQYRNAEGNSEKIQKVKESVVYSYADTEDNSSQALLYADIAVSKDKELASLLLNSISKKLPEFIEDNVEQQDVACEYISSFSSVEKLEENSPVGEAIKYGIIAAVAGCFIVCCVVVVSIMVKSGKTQSDEALEEAAEEELVE